MTENRINVDKPLWDQKTFYGRFRHFAWLTNPLNGLHSTSELEEAKKLIIKYKSRKEPPETSRGEVVEAVKLYKSSFHPDSGELQNVFGRMSFQVPGGMLITGAMLQFYKSVPQVIFWQWFNQSFNALVNYTNRNADSPTSSKQLFCAYVSATFGALGTAIGLKKFLEPRASPVMQRFVPFAAVASANCINIPLMRYTEITDGIDLKDSESGNAICKSRNAAVFGISCVVLSRIAMAAPGMLFLPLIMEKMEPKAWFARRKFLHAPFQILGVGMFLTLMVPTACSIFPQILEVSVEDLKRFDPEAYKSLKDKNVVTPNSLYFNKGL